LVLLAALSGIAEPWTLLVGVSAGAAAVFVFVALVSGFLFGRVLRAPNDPPATPPPAAIAASRWAIRARPSSRSFPTSSCHS
jgi:hypothetical protein